MLNQLPDVVVVAIFVVASVSLAQLGLLIFRRIIREEAISSHSSIASSTFGLIGLLYAVITGSLVASGWASFRDAQTSSFNESNALGDMLRAANAFDEPTKSLLQRKLLVYAKDVVDVEWPRLRRGESVELASPSYEDLWTTYIGVTPANSRETMFYSTSISRLVALGDERRTRVLESESRFSPELWVLFIGGGIIAVFFTYFFAPKRSRYHLLLLSLLASLFGFVLYLLFQIQTPYTGGFSVSVEPFVKLLSVWQPRVLP